MLEQNSMTAIHGDETGENLLKVIGNSIGI